MKLAIAVEEIIQPIKVLQMVMEIKNLWSMLHISLLKVWENLDYEMNQMMIK